MGRSLPANTAAVRSSDSRAGTRLLRLQHTQTLHISVQLSVSNTTSNMAVSKIRRNYHEECEALINKQINMEFYASYVYLSMASYFARDDIALNGFAEHFRSESGEERGHGIKLMDYQNSRGGKVVFQDIQAQLHGVGVPP